MNKIFAGHEDSILEVNQVEFYQQPQMTEYTIQYGDQTYRLVPESPITSRKLHEDTFGFGELNRVSQQAFERHEVLRQSQFTQDLQTRLKGVLPKDLCQMFIKL